MHHRLRVVFRAVDAPLERFPGPSAGRVRLQHEPEGGRPRVARGGRPAHAIFARLAFGGRALEGLRAVGLRAVGAPALFRRAGYLGLNPIIALEKQLLHMIGNLVY